MYRLQSNINQKKHKSIVGGIDMIRVGLVGIGTMGNVHYKAYKNIEGAEVVAVAEIRADMAKEKIGEDAILVKQLPEKNGSIEFSQEE